MYLSKNKLIPHSFCNAYFVIIELLYKVVSAVFVEQIVLEVPERLAEVDIVCLRILESQDLAPESIHLLAACLLDLLNVRLIVYELALVEDLYQKLFAS